MTTLREAAQQALEALENLQPIIGNGLLDKRQLAYVDPHLDVAITALRAALAEQAQPVAWAVKGEGLYWTEEAAIRRADQFVEPLDVVPLYTAPPAPQPLSGLDVERLLEDVVGSLPVARKLIRAVEAEVLKRMGVQR